jgi:hypothetical protein
MAIHKHKVVGGEPLMNQEAQHDVTRKSSFSVMKKNMGNISNTCSSLSFHERPLIIEKNLYVWIEPEQTLN